MIQLSEYIGRQVDLLAWQGIDPVLEVQLTASLGTTGSGQLITGLQVVMQQYFTELLNIRGSVRYDSSIGTEFLRDMQRGRWMSALDVEQSFSLANLDIKRKLLSRITPSTPLDMRFKRADLIPPVVITEDSVKIGIELATQDNNATIILPIPISTVQVAS